jgi:trehalose-phosphatase
MVRRSVFENILREMREIRYRLDEVEQSISRWKPRPAEISESELLLLPDHLRKTYMTVVSKGECSATEASNLTARCRAVESNYLNQLARAGWIVKQRRAKEIYFLALKNGTNKKNKPNSDTPKHGLMGTSKGLRAKQKNENGKIAYHRMNVECLSSDYDGTLSPINVSRSESHVPLDTRVMLRQISRLLPMSINTMKDLSFIIPRTPFAHAWSAIGGLEMQIGRRILKRESLESRLPSVSLAISHARSQITAAGVEIEEKNDSEGRTVAFCVDYRRARNMQAARSDAEQFANYCKALGLRVFTYGNQPFYDVYPVAPDKGEALKKTLDELGVKKGVLYLGDSEVDNSAFNVSNLSLGVVHDETPLDALNCEYYVKFEDVPHFLRTLIKNDLQFRSDFPMIKTNPNTTERKSGTRDCEKLSIG